MIHKLTLRNVEITDNREYFGDSITWDNLDITVELGPGERIETIERFWRASSMSHGIPGVRVWISKHTTQEGET